MFLMSNAAGWVSFACGGSQSTFKARGGKVFDCTVHRALCRRWRAF
jgi:hypothetical protein